MDQKEKLLRGSKGDAGLLLELLREAYRKQDDALVSEVTTAADQAVTQLERELERLQGIHDLCVFMEVEAWHTGHLDEVGLTPDDVGEDLGKDVQRYLQELESR